MEGIAIATSPEDIAYIRASYVTLATLARGEPLDRLRAWIGVQLPRASYAIGEELWFAADGWRLADEAGGVDGVRAAFDRRYRAAAAALGYRAHDPTGEWDAYLAGLYGACLRDVTPENIVAKAQLVERLDRALADPRPADRAWCRTLRADVDALDAIARPFAACDRIRFGRPTSRDRLIAAPRAAYPHVFA